jgi:hypothetical protein
MLMQKKIQRFRTPLSSRGVLIRGHHGMTSELLHGLFDPLIICGHNQVGKYSRSPFINPLDQGFPTQECQGFSGEPGRCISGRDNAQEMSHLFISKIAKGLEISF